MRNNFSRLLPVLFLFIPFITLAQEVPPEEDPNAQPENPGVTLISTDTTWTAGSEKFIDTDVIVSGATLTIERGVKLRFAPNQDLGVAGVFQIQGGKIIAEGTEAEPIIFTGSSDTDTFSLSFDNDGNPDQSIFRYVKIENAGTPNGLAGGDFGETPGVPALTFNGGNLRIENSSFKGSKDVDIRVTVPYWFGEVKSSLEIVNSNFEYVIPFKRGENDVPLGNTEAFFAQADIALDAMGTCPSFATSPCQKTVSLKNNYYGDTTGPDGDVGNIFGNLGEGKKVIGVTDYDGMRRTNLLTDPLILIPGIIGSQQDDEGKWIIDPILHVHDDLIASLQKNGYEEGKNLFIFPYDWKRDNRETASDLKGRIEEIKTKTGSKKVDIVAHSMGGLVARQYIQGGAYQDDVDQLMTLGTPHRGSPKAYLMWEGGEFGTDFFDGIIKNHFSIEAEHAGYANLYQYIREQVPSVQQLLPDYDYLQDVATGVMRSYPDQYPRNEFIENLRESIDKLSRVKFISVVGDKEAAISKIRVDVNETENLWEHGMPENFFDNSTDRGLEYSIGDATVPLFSAESAPSDKQEVINAVHNDLPSEAQCIVLKEFSGESECKEVSKVNIPNILWINVFSPIDIQVISPSGKRMGKNFETGGLYDEIADAFYTGYDTQNEFITIPNPEEGEYRILTEGTGDGEYRIEGTLIHENSDTSEATESMVTIRGIAETGKQEEKKVTVENNTVTGEDADTVAPMTEIVLAGAEGLNDWHTGDVSVSLSAMDNDGGSGVEKIEYSLDNGAIWNVYSESLTISREGVSVIQYFSTDKAGNKEAVKTREIKIDKTAPEAKVTFNPVTQKLSILGADSLGGVVAVVMRESIMGRKGERGESEKGRGERGRVILIATLTDQAGHTTILSFEKRKDKQNRIDLVLQSVSYDGVMTNFQDSGIQYKWQLDRKGKYQLLASHLKTSSTALESHYFQKRNETWIMERPRDLADEGDDDSDRRPLRKKLPGMVIPTMLTEQGKVKIVY